MTKKSNISYKDAIAEIEEILRSLREEQNDIDTLAKRVARATELIEVCRARLLKAGEDVEQALKE